MSRARVLADYVAGGTTAAEFDYLDGVTSNIQTQMDTKSPLASPTFTGNIAMPDDSIDLAHMNANSVDSDQYVDGSIDLVHMSANSVDSDQYVDGSIDLVHMSANSVDSDQYVDGSIDSAHIANDQIDSQHYAAASIDNEHLADDAVGTDELANDVVISTSGAITTTGGMTVDGATVFNEASADVDFRIESNDRTHAFFVDASNNSIGINDSNPPSYAALSIARAGANENIMIRCFSTTTTHAPYINLTKSHHGTIGTYSATQDDGVLGGINFVGVDTSSGDETAATIVVTQDGAAGSYVPGKIEFKTATSSASTATRMTIDKDGKVGIGTTSPSANLEVVGSFEMGDFSATGASYGKQMETAQESTLNSSGSGTGNFDHIRIFNGNGMIGRARTENATMLWTTGSDYRLKENEVPLSDGLTRLNQLKPYRFNFKTNPNLTLDGFFAHEAQAVVPEAVSGNKDEMTKEVLYVEGDDLPEGKSIGDIKETEKIDIQGIDLSKLVPLVVAAVQELSAKVTALENA